MTLVRPVYVRQLQGRQNSRMRPYHTWHLHSVYSSMVMKVTPDPERHATSSFGCCCPLAAASRGKSDIGKSRHAFVRARMRYRGPAPCSVMRLPCHDLLISILLGKILRLGC